MIPEHRSRIKLSERLMMSAGMVTPGSAVADIGCDHAHTSIWLVKNGIASRAVAMDVRKGPLEKARGNICLYGLKDRIELRLSDGLLELGENEADSIIIAGMGGMLTIQILDRSLKKALSAKELILQPQSDIGMVRRYIRKHGFKITHEKMCKESGKYYNSMRIVPVRTEKDKDLGKSGDIAAETDDHAFCKSGYIAAENEDYKFLGSGYIAAENEDYKFLGSGYIAGQDVCKQDIFDEFGEILLKDHNEILKEQLLILKGKNERNINQITLRNKPIETGMEAEGEALGNAGKTADKLQFLCHERKLLDAALRLYY